jgi:DNA-binding transcriptional MerR regulator
VSEPNEDSQLPDKVYFKIGEVSEIVGVEPYVLRYWETEFPALRPVKSRSQQRMYRKRDVELLIKIKRLLYDEMYTISGAKKALSKGGAGSADKPTAEQLTLAGVTEVSESNVLQKVEKEMIDLLELVDARAK